MFCQKCGSQLGDNAAFCSKCGASSVSSATNIQTVPPPPQFVAPQPTSQGNTLSTIGIVLGGLAFLFFPIIFGPAAVILGAVAKSKGESKAVIAMVVGGLGLVVGMILGVIAFSGV